LPGHSLVVYDPDLEMVVDLVPCEDAHAQERSLMEAAQSQAQPGDLWIADRNFSTRRIFYGLHGRGSSFIVREHGSTSNPQALEQARHRGRIETSMVYEQAAEIENDAGQRSRLRRVELQLDHATEEGDTTIRILTNLPASKFTPGRIARLYRQRWQIESLFQRL
jgi:IS4 transposase